MNTDGLSPELWEIVHRVAGEGTGRIEAIAQAVAETAERVASGAENAMAVRCVALEQAVRSAPPFDMPFTSKVSQMVARARMFEAYLLEG